MCPYNGIRCLTATISIPATDQAIDSPATYRIKLRCSVPESWIDRLGGMHVVAVSSAQTTLEGWLPDQAPLKGVLDTLYELRLCLEEVTCL